MDRNLERLGTEHFDLVVVGGGVYGAALTFEASRRNLRVALIERGDFASGASSNSLKILHGGLRHVQQLDLPALRRSVRARREWARLAPDLVRPLACVIPDPWSWFPQCSGVRGGPGHQRSAVAGSQSPGAGGQQIAREANCLDARRLRNLANDLITGVRTSGAQWWDAQALDTEQLVLHLLRLACANGACSANYMEAIDIIHADGRVAGVKAIDRESGAHSGSAGTKRSAGHWTRDRTTRRVAVTRQWRRSGPVVRRTEHRGETTGRCRRQRWLYRRGRRSITGKGIRSAERRELFVVPWRGRTMLGTHYVQWFEDRDPIEQRRAAVSGFLQLIDAASTGAAVIGSRHCIHPLGVYCSFTATGALASHCGSSSTASLTARSEGIQGLWSLTWTKVHDCPRCGAPSARSDRRSDPTPSRRTAHRVSNRQQV